MQTNKHRLAYMVELAVLLAILLMLEITGLGMFKTFGLELTILQIPVILGAIILGPAAGAILGGAFGLLSFWECFGKSEFGATLLGINPILTFVVCVPTRILMGWLCGLIFKTMDRKLAGTKGDFASYLVASLAGALLNTLLFMSALCLCFYHTDYIQAVSSALGAANVFMFVVLLVGVQGLVEAAGISEEDEEELRELLANKNFFGVEEFAETLNLKAELNELFHMLGSLNVDLNDLKRAKELAASYPRILAAIHNLEELHKVLEVYGIQKYISFELGIISSYQYYTGIIFSGYTFGSGEPIVKGGRYDRLLTYYGKTSASIGFAIVIDQLMSALSRQKINISIETNGELIVYTKANQAKAILSAKEKRAAGTPVETILKDDTKTNEDYQNYAKRNRIRTVTFMED